MVIDKMRDYYFYLFYRCYRWNCFINRGKDRFGHQAGWFILSLILWFFLLDILIMFQIITGYGFNQLMSLPNPIIVITASIFLIPNYYIFIHKKKYIKVIKKFENEKLKYRIISDVILWLLLIFPLVLGMYLISFLK